MSYECEICTASFWYEDDYDEHMDDYGHWPQCKSCNRVFRSWGACNQHMDAVGHWDTGWKCETCTKTYRSQNNQIQHMNAMDHWEPTFSCETCNSSFRTQAAANQHMQARGHYRNYCKSCDRRFDNENNLRMHLNSKIHRGRNIACPFCKDGYTTASGLSHHLETGSCPKAPRLNRETIYKMVRERDPQGVITHKQIGWRPEENTQYSATARAHNGYAWECYLCHREFKSMPALNQHLNSPAHKQQIYHCPNAGCSKPFTALAGLFNHLESESCAFMRFEKVQQSVGNVLQGGRLISF